MRHIERIEESYLRKKFKTTKGCPITQLYLKVGQIPARYEIQKMRLLYLKYILEQDEESKLKKFFNLQIEQPSRGDWASTCINDLKELQITLSLDEIKQMTKRKFTEELKLRIQQNALLYLTGKQGKKGVEIEYACIEMAEYLQPLNNKLSIEQKHEIYGARIRMVNIPYKFPPQITQTSCILC